MSRPVIGVGTLNISDKAKRYINDALNHNRLSYGPYMQKYEDLFAKIHFVSNAIMTSSGTDALRIALHALKDIYQFQDGDEVIIPSVTFISTGNIVIQNGLTPVFVDVDRAHYEIDPNLIEAKITPRTKAIIPVHLFGQPCDMDPILAIAKKHSLRVLEDSCETMFARYNGRPVGSMGDLGCFSSYVAHLIVTGVGGMITTTNLNLAVLCRTLVNHGRDPIYISIDDDQTASFNKLNQIVSKRFSFSHIGYSSRLTELEGALGLAQLEEYESLLNKRRTVARKITEVLSEFKEHLQLPSIREGNEHSFMMYPVVCRHESKDELVNFLEQAGIETRDMFPLISQSIYQKKFSLKESDYPVASWVKTNGFYIGCHQDISENDLAYIQDNFRSFFLKDSKKFKKASSVIILRNNIRNYNNLVKIQNVPFILFDEVIILGQQVAEEIKEYLNKEFPKLAIREGVQPESLAQALLSPQTPENVVFFDLTNMHNPLDIKKILFKLESGADMVVASRFIAGGQKLETGWMIYRGIGNRIFTGMMNVFFNGNCTDSVTSLRGIKLKHLRKFHIKNRNWYDYHYNISISAIQDKLNIEEFPSKEILYEDTRPVHNKFWTVVYLLISLLRRGLLHEKIDQSLEKN